MTARSDDPRGRHLTPVDEPPFDPDYDNPRGHTPAQDTPAEQAVLGALLIDNNQIPLVADLLASRDFYRPSHEQIYDAILELHRNRATDVDRIDPIVLASHLSRHGLLEKIGGAPYLHTLTTPDVCPNPTNATKYAADVRDTARARTLYEVGTQLRQLGTKTYAADLEAAYDHAYETLDRAAANYGPGANPANTGLADLAWILTGTPPQVDPPTNLHRTDGNALFYAAKINGLFGDPESGKTWIAQAAMVEALNNDGTAAMIDVDHNGMNHTAARLLLLGAHPHTLADPNRFRYYDPEDAEQLRNACRDVANRAPTVATIDSIGEILAMLAVNPNDETEVTNAFRATLVPIATAGTCAIAIDHLPKGQEARQAGQAIGSIAKKRMMRGSYIRVDARDKPAPGQIGHMTLRIEKDTAGELRRTSPGGYAGTFTLDSRDPRVTTWNVDNDDNPITSDGTFRPTEVMERISRYVEDHDRCTYRAIREAVGGKTTVVKTAIDILTRESYIVTMAGQRNAILHHSIAHYRAHEDTARQDPTNA